MNDYMLLDLLNREDKENLKGLILDLCHLDKNNYRRIKDLIHKK